MKVTDLDYFLDPPQTIENLNTMCRRCSGRYKHQNLVITDGKEGFGKSTLTAACAYYMAHKMKRPMKLFFDAKKLMEVAKDTQDEILIWDDAAYAGLTVESYNKLIIDLIKIIWLARKKRNTYFINIQEFFRLKELLVSRAIALFHVYSPDKIKVGKYAYFNEDYLIRLYDDWQRRKQKNYKKYYTFRGSFPNVLYKIFDEKEYEDLKDEAILKIGDDVKKVGRGSRTELNYNNLKKKVSELPNKLGITNVKLAKELNMSDSTLTRWSQELDVAVLTPDRVAINRRGFIEPLHQDYLGVAPKRPIIKPEPIIFDREAVQVYNRPALEVPQRASFVVTS